MEPGMTQAPAPLGTRAAHSDGHRGPRIGAHLFIELRGFADLVAAGAATAAAAVLLRFTSAVTDSSGRYPAAELRAEGDSAYVAFPNAADAVACALAVVGGFRDNAGGPGVACGIATDAGTQPTDGYLAASSVCGAAAPGEVLLTDEVRRLAGN